MECFTYFEKFNKNVCYRILKNKIFLSTDTELIYHGFLQKRFRRLNLRDALMKYTQNGLHFIEVPVQFYYHFLWKAAVNYFQLYSNVRNETFFKFLVTNIFAKVSKINETPDSITQRRFNRLSWNSAHESSVHLSILHKNFVKIDEFASILLCF